jgi:hypothetical protein
MVVCVCVCERERERVSENNEEGEREIKSWHSHFPRDSISALWKSELMKGLAQNPMIKPVNSDTITPAASFLKPL